MINTFLVCKNEKKSKTIDTTTKDIRNLFTSKKEKEEIKDKIPGDIRSSFQIRKRKQNN